MGYITLAGSAFTSISYTIRGFTPDSVPTNVTTLDAEYHSSGYMGSSIVGATADMPEVFRENWTGAGGFTQAQLDGGATAALQYPGSAYPQTTLDLLNQNSLEGGFYTVQDIDGTYNPGLLITGIGTTEVTTESKVLVDDLKASPFNGTANYFIQMAVWGFPSSATADLANCYVTFSSSDTFEPSQTLTIPFNSGSVLTGTATIAAGGDFTWKVNRNYLESAGVDLTNLKKVKIGMKALTGTFTFKAENLKLVTSDYPHYKVGINTKLGRFKQERWPGTTQADMPAIVQDSFEAKNFTHIVRFNSGNSSGTANPNEFSIFYRVHPDRASNPNSYIKIRVVSDDTQIKIEGYEGPILRYSQVASPLNIGTEHTMIVYLEDDKIRTVIYESEASRLKTLKIDTNVRTVSILDDGFVGFEFKPYYGNFYIDYMYARDLIVAEYESETYESYSPVNGVALYPQSSTYSNLVNSTFEEAFAIDNLIKNISDSGQHNANSEGVEAGINDVYVSVDTSTTVSGTSYKVTKDVTNAYIASLRYPEIFVANDLSALTISGYLRYEAGLEATKKSDNSDGSFRIILWDKWFQKPLYIGEIQDTVSNKWNYFEMPIIADVYANEFNFEIQHCGTASTSGTASFWIEGVEIKHKSIVWEASNNDGKSWTKFYDNLNEPYKTIRFPNDEYQNLVLNYNPKIYWKFDETSGLVALDSSGTNNNGVYAGTANITYNVAGTEIIKTDPNNSAIKLVNGGSVICASPTGLSTAAVTVSTWFRTGTALAQDLIVQSGTASGTWKLQTTNTGIKFDIYNSGTVLLSASADVNYYDDVAPNNLLPGTSAWHNVVATYDKSYLKLYFDGELKASIPGTVNVLASPQISIIGPSSGYRYQDEVEIYASAMSEQDVVRHYNAGVSTYNKLKVRARAYTLDAWISSYQLTPYYAKPGRYLELPNSIISINSVDKLSDSFGTATVRALNTISQGTANSIASAQAFGSVDVYKKQIYLVSIDSVADVRPPTVTYIRPVPAFRGVGYTDTYSNSTPLALNAPSGVQTGDVLIAICGVREVGAGSIPGINWSTGWNEITDVDWNNNAGTLNRNYSVAWRVYSGSMGEISWTGGAPNNMSISVAAYSGASTVLTNGAVTTLNSGTAITPGSVVTTLEGVRMVMAAYISDFTTVTNPAGYTTRQHALNSFVGDGSAVLAGTVSGLTWTTSSSQDMSAMLVAVY